MSKIKFQIITLPRALVFQVLGMDQRFRATEPWSPPEHFCKNGMVVSSDESPGMKNNTIYLWGLQRHCDFIPFVKAFHSDKERDEYKIKMINAIGEWSNEWIGWLAESEPQYFELEGLQDYKLIAEN